MSDLYYLLLIAALYAVTHLLVIASSCLATPLEKAK